MWDTSLVSENYGNGDWTQFIVQGPTVSVRIHSGEPSHAKYVREESVQGTGYTVVGNTHVEK